jgi:exodeoxyribonuclease-3
MKLISWNINGIRAAEKKGNLKEIFDLDADIYCFQETKAEEVQLDREKFFPLGYHAYFESSKTRKGYSGVAIYSKIMPEKVVFGLGDPLFDDEGRTIIAEYKDFVLMSAYFPNGNKSTEHFDMKLKFHDEFLNTAKKYEKSGMRVIFCGDLNIAHREIDLARPKENEKSVGFLPIEREKINKIIEDKFIDTYRKVNGDKVEYSWWDQKTSARERNIGWRIDYFFVSKDLENKIKKASILTDFFGSDHAPCLLEINL